VTTRGEHVPRTAEAVDLAATGDDGSPSDVLDLGTVGEPTPALDGLGSSGAPSRRRLLAAAGVLAAGLVGARTWHGQTWTASTSIAPSAHGPVETSVLPRPLPGVAADWDLFGLGDDVLLRIHPASGRITRTRIPPVGDGQVSLVPVRGRVLVRPLGEVPGYVVPDDGRPVLMSPALAGTGSVLPGPDPDHVWIQVDEDRTTMMALLPLDGSSAVVEVPVPEFATTGPMTDGAGGVLFEGVGGLYSVSPTGRQRVSNAILLAVGPTALLTLERDVHEQWRTLLRPAGWGGGARRLPVPIGPQLPHGVLAPDARTVVLYVLHQRTAVGLALVDLATGVPDGQRVHEPSVSVGAGVGTVVWLPDSRRIVTVDSEGRLVLIDVVTGTATLLAGDLPAVRQLAVRTPS
jgi:hypothetical protein